MMGYNTIQRYEPVSIVVTDPIVDGVLVGKDPHPVYFRSTRFRLPVNASGPAPGQNYTGRRLVHHHDRVGAPNMATARLVA
jgi:hypothetical protein